MKTGRLLLTSCLIVAVGMASPTLVFSQADVIVVCQKKGKMRLRPDGCKPKETPVLDLTGALDDAARRITDIEQTLVLDLTDGLDNAVRRITDTERYLGLICEGDASRTVFAGGPGSGACGPFTGDPAACQSAFQSTGPGTGAVSCFADQDQECAGCEPNLEGAGFCTNTCAPQ